MVQELTSVMPLARRPVLFFSADKDSLAVLLLLRPYWDDLAVVWVNPGAAHWRTVAYMDQIAAIVPHFHEARGDQPGSIRANGWPADVVPVRATLAGEVGAGRAPMRFQPYTQCCGMNLWQPMQQFLQQHDADLVIGGQRRAEPLRNRLRDAELSVIEGLTYWQPLHDWSDEEVVAYIQAQGYELPPFYAEGAKSSVDCWNCTAYLDHNAGHLAHMRTAEPQAFAVVNTVLLELRRQIKQQAEPLNDVLGVTGE